MLTRKKSSCPGLESHLKLQSTYNGISKIIFSFLKINDLRVCGLAFKFISTVKNS